MAWRYVVWVELETYVSDTILRSVSDDRPGRYEALGRRRTSRRYRRRHVRILAKIVKSRRYDRWKFSDEETGVYGL